MTELRVSYSRRFSDHEYGSEELSAAWTWSPPESDDGLSVSLAAAAEALRQLVLGQLAHSASSAVASAANHELHARDPKPAVTVGTDEISMEDLPF